MAVYIPVSINMCLKLCTTVGSYPVPILTPTEVTGVVYLSLEAFLFFCILHAMQFTNTGRHGGKLAALKIVSLRALNVKPCSLCAVVSSIAAASEGLQHNGHEYLAVSGNLSFLCF